MRITKEIALSRKEEFPVGARVELLHLAEEDNFKETLPPGTKGTVRYVDSLGTVHIQWDNGSRLGALPEDSILLLEG